MFTAKLEAQTWKKIINALSSVIEEVSIEITPEGLKFTAMDPSHICMVDFSMGKEHFEEYNATGNETMGVDVDEMRKIMNRSKPDETLTLSCDEAKMIIEFQKKDSDTKRRFRIPQIDVIQSEKYKVPHLDTTATLETSSSLFSDTIKDIHLVSDIVTFTCTEAMVVMSGEGDSASALVEIREWWEYSIKEECKACFNLAFLTDIIKNIEDKVKLHIGNDLPLKLCFNLFGADFTFILAPRVDREGE